MSDGTFEKKLSPDYFEIPQKYNRHSPRNLDLDPKNSKQIYTDTVLDVVAAINAIDTAWLRGVHAMAVKNFYTEYSLTFKNDPQNPFNGLKVEKISEQEDGQVKVKFLEGKYKDDYEAYPPENIKKE